MTAGQPDGVQRLREPRLGSGVLPGLVASVDSLPVGLLLLAEDGTAVEVNETWACLSGVPALESLGSGWSQAVSALDRLTLRPLLRDAALSGLSGSEDFRLTGPAREQWSRWCWKPGPDGRLIVSVVGLGDSPPWDADPEGAAAPAAGDPPDGSQEVSADPAPGELVSMVAYRLFGVGLAVQSAVEVTREPWRHRLQEAVDELDSVIRDVRSAIF